MRLPWCFRFPRIWYRVHLLLVVWVFCLSLWGQMPVCQGGWFGYLARVVVLCVPGRAGTCRYRQPNPKTDDSGLPVPRVFASTVLSNRVGKRSCCDVGCCWDFGRF